jgi:xanthine permease XanP
VGAFIEIILSRFLHLLKKIITPVVTGTVVMLIGLSLVRVGITDMAGGQYLKDKVPDQFGTVENLSLGILVLLVVLILNRFKNPMIRMSSIVGGIIVGYVAAYFFTDKVKFDFGDQIISIPQPFKYGLDFNFWEEYWYISFFGVAFIYIITTIESTGDLTATSMLSGEPVEGEIYMERIKGGVLGDGVNSAIAAMFNTFPNTTFSQNNGVIQMTGVASRFVGMYLAGFLVLLGLFPVIGEFFRSLPNPVLGGATIVMFGTVAAAGVNIIASMGQLRRREILIIAVSLGIGLGLAFVPEVLSQTPKAIQQIFGSAITSGGLCALILNMVLPQNES